MVEIARGTILGCYKYIFIGLVIACEVFFWFDVVFLGAAYVLYALYFGLVVYLKLEKFIHIKIFLLGRLSEDVSFWIGIYM